MRRALVSGDALAVAHSGEDGAVVTHGTTLRLVVGHLTGAHPGSLPHGAVAVLDGEPGAGRIAVHPVDTLDSE